MDGVADAEVTTVRGFRALSGLGRSPGVHLSSSRRWGQWVRGACRSCTFFLLTVCTLADSARCFSGHMANDNPVHSFFVVTVDTWAGVVLCGAGGYYAFEVNTFSHTQYFHFCRSARKESDPADFFQTLALLHRTIFYLFLLYVNFTVQSSTLYVVDLSPPIRQGLGSLALLQRKKNATPFLHFRDAGQDDVDTEPERRKHSSLTTLWRKKNLSSSTLEICAHPDPEQSHSKYNLLSKGAARSFATVPHNPCLRDIAFPSAIDCTGKHYCESGWVFL